MLDLILTLSLALTAPDPHPELPPLALVRGLPSLAHAQGQVRHAESFLKGYSGNWLGRAAVDWNVWFWYRILAIQNTVNNCESRRYYLQELVDYLGWEAVLTGRIPPAVPLDLIPVR